MYALLVNLPSVVFQIRFFSATRIRTRRASLIFRFSVDLIFDPRILWISRLLFALLDRYAKLL